MNKEAFVTDAIKGKIESAISEKKMKVVCPHLVLEFKEIAKERSILSPLPAMHRRLLGWNQTMITLLFFLVVSKETRKRFSGFAAIGSTSMQ